MDLYSALVALTLYIIIIAICRLVGSKTCRRLLQLSGAAASEATHLKKYSSQLDHFEFLAFAIETLGPWSSDSKNKIADKIVIIFNQAVCKPLCLKYVPQRVIECNKNESKTNKKSSKTSNDNVIVTKEPRMDKFHRTVYYENVV